ncbi:MAG: glycosyltransferase family 2 protein [Leptolyngbyaceae cyanobacterium]
MSKTPKVSVVIPVYNSMRYLPDTLDSVARQTLSDFEVILINDGSSDAVETWFDSNRQDARFRLVSQPNQGVSVARNTGISLARGEYIAFLDADDLWQPTKLEQQVQILDDDPETGLVYSWVACIDSESRLTGRVRMHSHEGRVWPALIQYDFVEGTSTAMVRQSCFAKVGCFDPSLLRNQDWDMWLRIAKHYSFRVVTAPLVYYRQHGHSISKDWPIVEASFHQVLSREFKVATPDMQPLQARSYGLAYLYLGWKPIQYFQKDHSEAIRLLKQAKAYDPSLQFSSEFIRLAIAIIASKYLGDKHYSRLLNLLYSLRRRFSRTKSVAESRGGLAQISRYRRNTDKKNPPQKL